MNTTNNEKNTAVASVGAMVWKKFRALLGLAAKGRVANDAPTSVTPVKAIPASRREHTCGSRPYRPANRKPTYRPVSRGTTFLIDTANLIGAIGPEQAASRLTNLGEMLVACGHSAVFFWEHAAYTWTKAQQETLAEKQALQAFVARENVSLVSGESDLAILQVAQKIPNSICLTRDRLSDYAETYPKIVGSSRHRAFSVAKVAGMVTLSVFGLKDAIVLSGTAPQHKPVQMHIVATKPNVAMPVPSAERKEVARPVAPARRAGLYGCADARLAAGDGRKALKLLAQIARNDPAAYDEMAHICREGDGVPADAALAKRYARLAKQESKAARQLARRQKRQAANCNAGLGLAGIHGAKGVLLAHEMEECARRKAESHAFRRSSRKRIGAMPHFVRLAA